MTGIFDKSPLNPVLGPGIGTCFDVTLLFQNGIYRMWFSWRDKKAIALVESNDGVHWTKPPIVVLATPSGFRRKLFRANCENVSRPCVVFHQGKYHLWHSFHAKTISIAYAVSDDGISWKQFRKPVLIPEHPWEKDSAMCPCVIYDEQEGIFKMWYSGGEQYEPDAVGYATSPDGVSWKKHALNPVLASDSSALWERDRVTAMHVIKENGSYLGFYIGFANGFENSCIGLASSKNGIDWKRHEGNPILTPGTAGEWDDCNIYKPYVLHRAGRWMLWYNASRRSDRLEQIGLATCSETALFST